MTIINTQIDGGLDTVTTEIEAREIQDAIDTYKTADQVAAAATQATNVATAQTWFDALGTITTNPTTRSDALTNFTVIEGLLTTESDQFRLSVLRKEKVLANAEYITVKAATV